MIFKRSLGGVALGVYRWSAAEESFCLYTLNKSLGTSLLDDGTLQSAWSEPKCLLWEWLDSLGEPDLIFATLSLIKLHICSSVNSLAPPSENTFFVDNGQLEDDEIMSWEVKQWAPPSWSKASFLKYPTSVCVPCTVLDKSLMQVQFHCPKTLSLFSGYLVRWFSSKLEKQKIKTFSTWLTYFYTFNR